MSTSATRIRRARAIDTLGVLAVVAGMVLGLVPGLAPTAAWAAEGRTLSQCSNDANNDDVQDDCFWQNGNLGVNDSAYREGDSVGFRAVLTDLEPSTEYTVPIEYDMLEGDYIAYDQLTAWDRTVPTGVQPTEGTGLTGPGASHPIPPDPYQDGTVPRATGDLDASLWGGAWVDVAYEDPSPATLPTSGGAVSVINFTFVTDADGGTAVLAWGGHISRRIDWNPVGYQTAVEETTGSPYHMRFGGQIIQRDPDGTETGVGPVGSQDRSLKAAAVITPSDVSIVKYDEDGSTLTGFDYTITGPDGFGASCTTPDCSFQDVQPGSYTVTETGVAEGYVLADPDSQTVEIGEGEDVVIEFVNPRMPYAISVTPETATNALDDTDAAASEHEFTVLLTADGAPMPGETVILSWDGGTDSTGEIVEVNGGDTGGVTSTTCTTDATGECSVVVNTSSPGAGTLTASWDTPYQATVSSPDPLPSTTADGEGTIAYPTIADSGDKAWVGLDASIEADGLNLLGDQHDFTVYVWEVDGEGADDGTEPGSEAPGATVKVSWSGPTGSTIDTNASSSSCVTAADGTCTVTVDSDANAGTGTATITSVSGTVTGEESATTTFAAGERTADKTWREYKAWIDSDSVNPAGESHTFNVTVKYRDDAATSWDDATLAADGTTIGWNSSGDGSDDLAASTCDDTGTTSGTCTIVVTSTSQGSRTVTLTSVDGELLGDAGATDETYAVSDVATKTWLAFEASIVADATNLVGENHVFTVTVQEDDGTGYVDVPEDTVVEFTMSDGGASLVSETCSDPGTSSGQCTITVSSSTPGSVTVTVTGIDQYGGFDTVADVTFTQSDTTDADKTWIDYRAFIEADGVNLVGVGHDFTVTAQYDDGSGWQDVPDDTPLAVTASGLPSATVDQSDCADGTTDGECTVTVDSDTPGTLTVTVDTVGNSVAVDSPVTEVSVSDGANLEGAQATSADKTWIAYRADIQATATNLTGQQHVFDLSAEQNDGTGWTDVPTGTSIGYSTDNDSTVQGTTCGSTTDGQCTVTVNSNAVDDVTVTITSVSAEDVDGDPDATVANTALSATAAGSLSATKTWIEVVVDVEADETNVVGENHTFTIDVDVIAPSGTVEPSSGTLVASTSGVGSEVDQSCDDGLDADGKCTVEVDSTVPGDRVVTAETLTFTYDGTTFTDVDLDGAEGIASSTDLTATKTWREYRVDIEAHDLNRVRESHTFTVTIEQTDDGSTWSDVPDGTTATVDISGTAGSITGGTCQTTGTTDGECTVVVDSTTAGTGTVTVSDISVDLPEEERTDIPVDVANDSAAKIWAAFRTLISPDSVNITGDSHDFTLTGQYTVDGSTWLDVPDGSSIEFSDSGVGSTTGDTCDSTVSGDCTVTVDSASGGDRDVTVTGIDPAAITATGPDGDIVRDFGLVTLADDAVGIAPGTDTDVGATKTWASYTLQLEPATATNLLSGQPGDTERYHTITATLSSDDATNAPVGGQTIDLSISGDTGVIDSVEDGIVEPDGLSATCVTDTDGTCDIVIFSGTPGQATLSGSYEATVGDSEPVTVDGNDAVKTWTTFRVTVTPETAVNLVDNPHVFTVTVEQSDSDGDWDPVVGTVPTIEVTGTDLTVDTSDCDAGTDAAGQCTVTVTSSTVQAVTLTATHTESYDDYDAEVEGQSTVGFTDSGDKDWIDYAIDVTPDTDENLVDTDHVFTVTVKTTFPSEGGTTTAPVVDGAVSVDLDGLGSITDDSCAEGTDASGQCTVTISSAAAGESSLTATYMGTAADDEEVRSYDDTAVKDWVDYELVISDDAVNAVGDEHTFTATLTVDTGEGFGPAAGETLAFTVDGVGTVSGGDVDEALECTTDASGQCDLLVNSDEAGATNVGVAYDAVVGATSRTDTDDAVKQWVDIELVKTAVTSDGFSDGDLIADPGGFPFLSFTSSDQGPKTAVFEYLITNPSNVTLEDVALTDDRLGTIDLAQFPDCQTLDPGESCTARGSEQFDYFDATAALAGPITNVGTVTATGGGEEVSATDDATITLVAVQSSILIDLVKDVVAGEGDVEAVDGLPTVDWSQEEYEAGESRTVRYRFTVTNISNSPIIDVELVDPMISDDPLIAVSDGVTLQPGESTVVEVDHLLGTDEAFPDGPIASRVDNVATVSGANETRDSFSEASDDASVHTTIVFAEVLPATGFGAGALLPLSVLLMTVGIAILWLGRRRRTTR